jgi:hypothetical protein
VKRIRRLPIVGFRRQSYLVIYEANWTTPGLQRKGIRSDCGPVARLPYATARETDGSLRHITTCTINAGEPCTLQDAGAGLDRLAENPLANRFETGAGIIKGGCWYQAGCTILEKGAPGLPFQPAIASDQWHTTGLTFC